MKSCDNCAYRMHTGFMGNREPCFGWECCLTAEDAIKTAKKCKDWRMEADSEDDEHEHTSATEGDYSPSNPWDAPGMNVRDFI